MRILKTKLNVDELSTILKFLKNYWAITPRGAYSNNGQFVTNVCYRYHFANVKYVLNKFDKNKDWRHMLSADNLRKNCENCMEMSFGEILVLLFYTFFLTSAIVFVILNI